MYMCMYTYIYIYIHVVYIYIYVYTHVCPAPAPPSGARRRPGSVAGPPGICFLRHYLSTTANLICCIFHHF